MYTEAATSAYGGTSGYGGTSSYRNTQQSLKKK